MAAVGVRPKAKAPPPATGEGTRFGVGDAVAVTFTPAAIQEGCSLDIRRGRTVLLHLVPRPALGALVVNDCQNGVWGNELRLALAPAEMRRPVTVQLVFSEAGTVVRLADGREAVFLRYCPDGRRVELALPSGVTLAEASPDPIGPPPADPAAPIPGDGVVDIAGWLGQVAAGCSIAELGSLFAPVPMLPLHALQQGATAVTLVDASPLTAASWSDLWQEAARATRPGRPAQLLCASWAEPDLAHQVGRHDITLVHDVLVQVPDPLRFLLELRAMTARQCYLSVPVLADRIAAPGGTLDLSAAGAVLLPVAPPEVLALLDGATPRTGRSAAWNAGAWISGGEANPHLQWWAVTRRHVEGLVVLAGFTIRVSRLVEDTQRLQLVLDA